MGNGKKSTRFKRGKNSAKVEEKNGAAGPAFSVY